MTLASLTSNDPLSKQRAVKIYDFPSDFGVTDLSALDLTILTG